MTPHSIRRTPPEAEPHEERGGPFGRRLRSLSEILQRSWSLGPSARRVVNRVVIMTLLLLLFVQSVYLQRVVNQNLQSFRPSDLVLLGTNAFNLGYLSGAKAGINLEKSILLDEVSEDRVLGEIMNMAYDASAQAALNGVFDQAFLLVVEPPKVDSSQ